MAYVRVFRHWGISKDTPLVLRPGRRVYYELTMPVNPESPTAEELPLAEGSDASRVFQFRFISTMGEQYGACFGKAQVVRDGDDPFVMDDMGIIPQDVLNEMGLIALRPSTQAMADSMLGDLIALDDAGRQDLIKRYSPRYAGICRFSRYPQSTGVRMIWENRDVALARAIFRGREIASELFRQVKAMSREDPQRKPLVQELLRVREGINMALCHGAIELRGDELWINVPSSLENPGGRQELLCQV